MAVQAVGYSNNYIPQQVQTKKQNNGKVVLGTAIAAAGGAYGGNAVAEHIMGDMAKEAEKYTIGGFAKDAFIKESKKVSDITEDAIEKLWENNKESVLKNNKKAYEDCLKTFKNFKTKYAVIGGVTAGLIALITGIIIKNKNKQK